MNQDDPTQSEPDNPGTNPSPDTPTMSPTRHRLHEIIFEAETPAGKKFDLLLLFAIIVSVICVMLDSVDYFQQNHHRALLIAEWFFTIIFTIEYVLRLYCVTRPLRYATSFYGVVDLLSILPTYISLILTGSQSLMVVRALRLLRIFRVLKLAHFISDSNLIAQAIKDSRRKILIFLFSVLTIALIVGSLMYLIEGRDAGFTSIPRSMYWAIVTITTVGYGDIAPQTALGQFLAATLMIIGYSILAVPTGIISAEIAIAGHKTSAQILHQPTYPVSPTHIIPSGQNASDTTNQPPTHKPAPTSHPSTPAPPPVSTTACTACSREGHDADATHCKYCGTKL